MTRRCSSGLGLIKHDFGRLAGEMIYQEWLLAKYQRPKAEAIMRYLGSELESLRRLVAQRMAETAVEAHEPCPPCPPCGPSRKPRGKK